MSLVAAGVISMTFCIKLDLPLYRMVERPSVAEAHAGDGLVIEVLGHGLEAQSLEDLAHCTHLLGCVGARDGGVACYPKYSKLFTYCQQNTI